MTFVSASTVTSWSRSRRGARSPPGPPPSRAGVREAVPSFTSSKPFEARPIGWISRSRRVSRRKHHPDARPVVGVNVDADDDTGGQPADGLVEFLPLHSVQHRTRADLLAPLAVA